MKVPFRPRRRAERGIDDEGDYETVEDDGRVGAPLDQTRLESDRSYLEAYGVAPSAPDVVPVSEDQPDTPMFGRRGEVPMDTGEVPAARPGTYGSEIPDPSRPTSPIPDPAQPGSQSPPVGRPEPRASRAAIEDDYDDGGHRPNVADGRNERGDEADPAEGDSIVDADDLSSLLEELRSPTGAEQRSAWGYLGLLSGMFVLLVGFGWACSDQRSSDVAGSDPVELMTGAEPTNLVFEIDGDVVAAQGSVPDEAARSQLLTTAQAVYGSENVVDDLTVDDGTTLEGGTVRFNGSAAIGDDRPEALQSAVESTFGLVNRGFNVGSVETVLSPVNAEVVVTDAQVTLSGVLPDEQSLNDLVSVAGESWGPENVDSTALSVGDTTWTDGLVRVTGSTTASDQRVAQFDRLVSERIDTLVDVDTSALTLVDDSQRLAEVQSKVDELVAASPIQFAPNSPVIDAASDELLGQVAAALNEVPDVKFEVVGHTDNVGDDQENLVLSQQRAAAVVERLAGLGVASDRMSSRGEGEDNPIADNATDEGKAANRRIEFVLFGTSESAEPSE